MAIYDDNLSEDVSLSRILDEFIVSGEKPETIVSFLKKYEADFKEIASRSLYLGRIYFAGYLKELHMSDAMFFMSHLEDIDREMAMKCVWQCMRSSFRCVFSAELKTFISRNLVSKSINFNHPYNGYGSRVLEDFDRLLDKNGFFPEAALSKMSADGLNTFMARLPRSLYSSRILQEDVYRKCPVQVKYVMLNMSDAYPLKERAVFLKQLLVSSASVEEKYMACACLPDMSKDDVPRSINAMQAFFPSLPEDGSLIKQLKHAKSYPPIALQLLMNGEDVIADSIFYLLAARKYNILAEMAESDADLLEANFPVKDVIDYITARIAECKKAKKNARKS